MAVPVSALAAQMHRPPARMRRASGLLWLLPMLVIFATFYAVPLARMVFTSFDGAQFDLKHYRYLLREDIYATVLLITVKISVYVTATTVLGYPIAYYLSRLRGPALIGLALVLYRFGQVYWSGTTRVRASGAQRRDQLRADGPRYQHAAVAVAVQHHRGCHWHELCPRAFRDSVGFLGRARDRSALSQGVRDAGCLTAGNVLACFFSAELAGRVCGRAPRLHYGTRILHHAGASWRRSSP
jgi:hypothetical protein